MHLYKHNKTGHWYLKLFTWVDCTNSSLAADEVVYIRVNIFKCRLVFHREAKEFESKFTKLL